MSYDHIVQDLCRKAGEDVQQRVGMTCSLLSDPADQMMVAIFAAGSCLASASAYCSALVEAETGERPDPETTLSALWEMIRPAALSASGGSREPFDRLIRQIEEAQHA